MDGLRLQAGAVRQPLGRPTRGRAQRHANLLGDQHLQDRVDQGGLAHAGAAGDHQHLAGESNPDGLALACGQLQTRPALHPWDRLGGVDRRPGWPGGHENPQSFGNGLLGPVEAGQEHAAAAFQLVGHDVPGLQLQRQCRCDQVIGNFQQLGGQRRQLLHRQTAMPLVHRLGQRVADAGTDPDQRRLLDPDLGRDLIRGAEPDAADVPGQTVGVLADHPHGIVAIGLVDPHGPRRTDAVGVQEQHDLPDDLLFRPAGDDPRRTLGADTGHLAQALRLLLDEIEHRLSEAPYQTLGVDRADAADHARGEIPLDALERCRRAGLEEGRAELLAVGAVVHPGATHLDELAGADHRRVADHGDQVSLAPGLDPQHAEPVLRVVERHPLHEAGQRFGCRSLGDIRHSPCPSPESALLCSSYQRYDQPVDIGSRQGTSNTLRQTTELTRVKARIKALAEKTVSNGCTEAEAMAAAEMVGRLLERYALSMEEIDVREQRCVQVEVPIGGKRRRPIDGCVTAIARFCDCKVWVSRDTMMPSYVFFGFDADTALAGYLFNVIDRAMATALTAFRATQPRLRGVGLRGASRSFQQGMAARVADRLDEMHRQRDANVAAQRSTGTALILVKQQVVEDAFRETEIRLVAAAGLSRARLNGAFRHGLAAGDRVNLNRPVGDAGRPLLP